MANLVLPKPWQIIRIVVDADEPGCVQIDAIVTETVTPYPDSHKKAIIGLSNHMMLEYNADDKNPWTVSNDEGEIYTVKWVRL